MLNPRLPCIMLTIKALSTCLTPGCVKAAATVLEMIDMKVVSIIYALFFIIDFLTIYVFFSLIKIAKMSNLNLKKLKSPIFSYYYISVILFTHLLVSFFCRTLAITSMILLVETFLKRQLFQIISLKQVMH